MGLHLAAFWASEAPLKCAFYALLRSLFIYLSIYLFIYLFIFGTDNLNDLCQKKVNKQNKLTCYETPFENQNM